MTDRAEAVVLPLESSPAGVARADSRGTPPQAAPAADFIARSAERFINRELSWLHFNRRVLEEAENTNDPLLERVRFLSICANNLDEFFMVRVAGLGARCAKELPKRAPTASPRRAAHPHREAVAILASDQQARWRELRQELAAENIVLVDGDLSTKAERAWPQDHFLSTTCSRSSRRSPSTRHIRFPSSRIPRLHHRAPADPRERRPRDERFDPRSAQDRPLHSPAQCRFQRGPADHPGTGHGPVHSPPVSRLEHGERAGRFPGHPRLRKNRDRGRGGRFRPPVETARKPWGRGSAIRLEMERRDGGRAQALRPARARLRRRRGLPGARHAGAQRAVPARPCRSARTSSWRLTTPWPPERIRDHGGDCFAAIRQKDLIVHHPYELFDVVVQFLTSGPARSRRGRDPADPLPAPRPTARSSVRSPKPPRPASR